MKKLYFCKTLALLLLLAMAFTSCNDNTVTTPKESPSVSEESSPAPSDQAPTPSPSENYTDLPVVDCEHEAMEFIKKDFPAIAASNVFSKKGLFGAVLPDEDSKVIAQLLNNGKGVKGEVTLDGDWYFEISFENGTPFQIQYSEVGIFFRYDHTEKDIQHLVLTDRQRDTVNRILEKLTEEPLPSLDSSDPSSVLSYINARCYGSGITNNKRTDLLSAEIAEQISLSTPYDTLTESIGTAHFISKTGSGINTDAPCYAEIFALSDGRILELKIKINQDEIGKAVSKTIIGNRILSITEFEKEYLTLSTEKTDERVARLRRALPFLYGLHILADTPFENDGLGYLADLSRNDALDPVLIDQINKEMYAPEVYSILGSPHVSYKLHASGYINVFAWYALSDGRILEVSYFPKVPDEQKQNDLLVDFGLSDKALFYGVSNVTVYNESELLDWVVFTQGIYRWRKFTN